MDEQLAHEVQAQVQGNPGGARAQEWREPEPAADGEPTPSGIPSGHQGTDTGDDRDPDMRDKRALVGSYLTRDVFPADRGRLIEHAKAQRAPDDVLAVLQSLPGDARYANAQELWAALDMPSGPRF